MVISPVFHPGRAPTAAEREAAKEKRARKVKIAHKKSTGEARPFFLSWDSYAASPLPQNHIRCLTHPDTVTKNWYMSRLLWTDRTLAQWHEEIEAYAKAITDTPLARVFYPDYYVEQLRELFYRVQRQRWLARVVVQRWRYRVWSRRPACNIDLIMNEPIPERDAITLTDTKNRTIYRFHRRDLFRTMMANLTAADEFLPTPRAPTNPWTNQPLTRPQAQAVCQRLLADFATRGVCPPPLFAAFWAARFNLKRFYAENSAALAQHAIRSYFADITPEVAETMAHIMYELITESNVATIATLSSIRRWLLQKPTKPQHTAWLHLCRDYTLYQNLHVQARAHWYSRAWIMGDVERLMSQTPDLETPVTRIQMLRHGNPNSAAPLLASSLLIQLPDINSVEEVLSAMQLIQQSFFGAGLS